MSNPIMLVDLDSTVCATRLHFFKHAMRLFPDIVGDKSRIHEEYDPSNVFDCSKKMRGKIKNAVFNVAGFWETIPSIQVTVYTCFKYSDRFDIYIATAPWDSNPRCRAEKTAWVQEYMPFVKDIYFDRKKWLLPGEVIIDDNVNIIEKSVEEGKLAIAPLYYYNCGLLPEGAKMYSNYLQLESILNAFLLS